MIVITTFFIKNKLIIIIIIKLLNKIKGLNLKIILSKHYQKKYYNYIYFIKRQIKFQLKNLI